MGEEGVCDAGVVIVVPTVVVGRPTTLGMLMVFHRTSLPLSLSSPIDVPLYRPLYMVVMRISLFSGGVLPLSPAHNRREALGRVWLRAEGRGEVR